MQKNRYHIYNIEASLIAKAVGYVYGLRKTDKYEDRIAL